MTSNGSESPTKAKRSRTEMEEENHQAAPTTAPADGNLNPCAHLHHARTIKSTGP